MGHIVILDELTANKIAAGEVVERPASVIKELVENSIDAGSTAIVIEIKSGGITYIRVSDNGSGIERDDAEIAFERHSTSKIRSSDDIDCVSTMGFRGEALASIASVSSVELITRTSDSIDGTHIIFTAGKLIEKSDIGCPVGTTIIVRDLFFNTPARYKFLKKDASEASAVAEIVGRIALGHPQISFKLVSNNKPIMHTPGSNNLISTITSVYGREFVKSLIEVNYSDERCTITGYVGKPDAARATRSYQSFYLNRRYIKSMGVASAVEDAYKTLVPVGKHPFAVLYLTMNPMLVDVNVHPTKMEVRFSEEQRLYGTITAAIVSAIYDKNLYPKVGIKGIEGGTSSGISYRFPVIEKPDSTPVQMEIDQKCVIEDKAYEAIVHIDDVKLVRPAEPEKKRELVAEPCLDFVVEPVLDIEVAPRGFEYRLIGHAFNTFIFLQVGEEVYIIDQHAAHERIVFERLIKRVRSGDNIAQVLIAPFVQELTPEDFFWVIDNIQKLEKLGFEVEEFGVNTIAVRAVPVDLDSKNPGRLLLDTIDALKTKNIAGALELDEYSLYTIACKSAVKANQNLKDQEIDELVGELSKLKNPYTCPHGRPIIVRMSKYEFERKFKRA